MTGPEHYGHAEQLLDMAGDEEYGSEAEHYHLAKAQVHATLALAAAVVDGPAVMRPEDRDEWDRATGRLEADR